MFSQKVDGIIENIFYIIGFNKNMSYLNPQFPLTDEEIKERLANYPIYIEQKRCILKEDESEIPDDCYTKIVNYLENQNKVADPSEFPADIGYNGYKWTQTDNKIKINYVGNQLEQLKADINGNIITSTGFISGLLYRIPQDFKITVDSNTILIELTVNEKWPILIVGGDNIDENSLFIMSYSVLYSDLFTISRRLLLHNAMRNNFCSIYLQSLLSLREGNKYASFYWNVLLYINCKNQYPTCFAVISEILMSADDGGPSAILAENILIQSANIKIPHAFLYLGFLHMSDINGFHSDDSLAFQYLKEAGEKYRVPKALDTLGRMYLFAIGVNQDIKVGFNYLREAGLTKDEIIDLLIKAQADESQIQTLFEDENIKIKNYKNDSSLKTVITACSAVAVTVVLFIGYKFFNRRK